MESRTKLFGHPIHPMLIVFPLGLLVTAVLFDILYMVTGNETLSTVAYWNIAGGIIGGIIAAPFGLIDWLAIPEGTRAKMVGMWHGLGNVVVLVLFGVAWFLRREDPTHAATVLPFILELVGVGLGTITAWLGGELVDRLGVGVDEGAHVNSPSSLSDEPATAESR